MVEIVHEGAHGHALLGISQQSSPLLALLRERGVIPPETTGVDQQPAVGEGVVHIDRVGQDRSSEGRVPILLEFLLLKL